MSAYKVVPFGFLNAEATFQKTMDTIFASQWGRNMLKSIKESPMLKNLKDLQILTGCIVALRRFIPQSSKKCLLLYNTIKTASKSKTFEWSKACEERFQGIKWFLTTPPVMTKA